MEQGPGQGSTQRHPWHPSAISAFLKRIAESIPYKLQMNCCPVHIWAGLLGSLLCITKTHDLFTEWAKQVTQEHDDNQQFLPITKQLLAARS